MENVFLALFVFGALFTIASVVMGFAGSALPDVHGGDPGHFGGGGHPGHGIGLDHGAPIAAEVGHGPALGPDSSAGLPGHAVDHPAGATHTGLPLLNLSALLAFLTWFGAAGYLLLHFGGWPLAGVLVGAVAAGAVGAVLVAAFLARVLAGERELRPEDYRLEGTFARVSVSIPEGGVGEIVFTKAGTHRGEAARSLDGRAIPREVEVAIIDYEHGVAVVQPWQELLSPADYRDPGPDGPSPDTNA